MKLVKLDLLRHIEGHSEKRVANMKRKMVDGGFWLRPICIERTYMLILDGQHRFEVANALGLKYVPCEFFDYSDVNLLVWSLRKECKVSKKLVITRALKGDIYPYKTAKHKFPKKVEKAMIPLKELRVYSKRCSGDIIDYESKPVRRRFQ